MLQISNKPLSPAIMAVTALKTKQWDWNLAGCFCLLKALCLRPALSFREGLRRGGFIGQAVLGYVAIISTPWNLMADPSKALPVTHTEPGVAGSAAGQSLSWISTPGCRSLPVWLHRHIMSCLVAVEGEEEVRRHLGSTCLGLEGTHITSAQIHWWTVGLTLDTRDIGK